MKRQHSLVEKIVLCYKMDLDLNLALVLQQVTQSQFPQLVYTVDVKS